MSTGKITIAIKNSLSAARMETYETATAVNGIVSPAAALTLYAWNAQVSAALLTPLHFCEIVTRNAVSEALEAVYGIMWPWSTGFEQSLPAPPSGYNPRSDMQKARRYAATTGKTVAELKFIFWQQMFTNRHDERLWNAHLRQIMPNTDPTKSVGTIRSDLYNNLEHIRKLRNRIAHHEPIFTRDLDEDLRKIVSVVECRSKATADWMMENQQASKFIQNRP